MPILGQSDVLVQNAILGQSDILVQNAILGQNAILAQNDILRQNAILGKMTFCLKMVGKEEIVKMSEGEASEEEN